MKFYASPIDPHVHLRGTEYETDFLSLGFKHAKEVDLCAVLEQPNPTPNLTGDHIIAQRLSQAYDVKGEIFHGIHIGITTDLDQVTNALFSVQRSNLVTADKTFYVHSTGNMGILDEDVQKEIWKIKGNMGYKGVSIGHFEAEDVFTEEFDPSDPLTHSLYQNPEAELEQVKRQIKNAYDNNFQGTFYIAHVSNHETIDYILSVEDKLGFEVVTEATFHHMFLNWMDYAHHGNRVKMNPPLRSSGMQERLLEHVLNGNIDIIGTDHAPHPVEKKDDPENPASGIQAIPFWPKGIELLRGYGINEGLLEDITFNNANRVFGLGLDKKMTSVEYNPTLWEAYGYNPFSRIDGS
jgi:dihydroorotase